VTDSTVIPAVPNGQPLDPEQIIREVNAVALECISKLRSRSQIAQRTEHNMSNEESDSAVFRLDKR
jgi:hypothetical protein